MGPLDLLIYYLFPNVWSAIVGGLITYFVWEPFSWLWNTFFGGGVPQVGPDSPTDIDALVALSSKNRQVQKLGVAFRELEAKGAFLSSQWWWIFEQAANDMCQQIDKWCPGMGQDLGQAYLWAITYRNASYIKYLDATYPGCGGLF